MWHDEKIDIIVWEDNKAWSVVAKFLEKLSTEIKWMQSNLLNEPRALWE